MLFGVGVLIHWAESGAAGGRWVLPGARELA